MHATTRAFLGRGGAACAAVAVVIGSTFAAGAAYAEPQSGPTAATQSSTDSPTTAASPTSAATASASPTTGTPAAAATESPAAQQEGLAEAIKRDLGKTVAEFDANGELAGKAAGVEAELRKSDPASVVSVVGNALKVVTSSPAAARQAAGTTKVTIVPEKAPDAAAAKAAAPGIDGLFAEYVKAFGVRKLQSIMVNAAGDYVIRTGDPATADAAPATVPPTAAPMAAATAPTDSVAAFAAHYGNVVVKAAAGPATAYAGDVVNGQGYATQVSGNEYDTCSVGWNGFDRNGNPAIISAGHCTEDGALKHPQLTDPRLDPAGRSGSPTIGLIGALGTFGFSQFGGPGNSAVTGFDPTTGQNDLGNIGTDVSVIDSLAPGLNQLPLVTHWSDPANLTAPATKVTGVSSAIIGSDICKSGRTTGWTCGTVAEVGVFLVGGVQDPQSIADVRAVRGFGSTTMASGPGDSGGPVISGTTAVGMTSAGGTDPSGTAWAYSADLVTALNATDGYTVKIHLNTPTLDTPANHGTIRPGGTITGTVAGAPAGTVAVITLAGKKTTATVDASGNFTFAAPRSYGSFTFSAQAKNGFSLSAASSFTLAVVKGTLPAPAITAPAPNGSAAAPVRAVTGTGTPHATITLSTSAVPAAGTAMALGAITGTAVADANGKWSVAVSPALAAGRYSVTAKQSLADWNDSQAATARFTVVPAAPAVTAPANGQRFAAAAAPSSLSGSSAAGASVSVTVDGQMYKAQVSGWTWKLTLGASFAPGTHSISATQTIDGLTSAAAASSFTVLAAPTAAGQPTAPAAPAAQGSVDGGSLAMTGASGTGPLTAAGGVLLLAGAALLLFRRRNASH
ncbi:S1 family peptidase [Arthrobacter sp. STN4]|uniref:S1 family peptidase n=1 Tax=Arthrobacter sp. STN4 TaxID=2923276 RepID=UPI002119DCAC|nr:LPXTG cell wall anchor domain-containing protein [Arthrobacter sp. STN4]MCQ9164831.1 LPXTG cell wall anchor domain-containing protein [Arthrobacter sp. STN4]